MRKLAIALLALFRRISLAVRKLRGQSEDDVAAQRVVSDRAWDEFCDTLKAAGASLNFPDTSRDFLQPGRGLPLPEPAGPGRADGLRQARRPAGADRVAHETVKLGSDNPDNHYLTAALSGTCEYRITGCRNTVAYLGFGAQARHCGQGGGLPPTGYVEASELEVSDDGRFELVLSCEPQEGNWLPMKPDTGMLIVRQTFLDRRTEVPAELHIERINCAPEEKSPAPPTQVDEGCTLVAGAFLLFAKWARDFQKHSNRLPRFDQETSNQAGGDPNIADPGSGLGRPRTGTRIHPPKVQGGPACHPCGR